MYFIDFMTAMPDTHQALPCLRDKCLQRTRGGRSGGIWGEDVTGMHLIKIKNNGVKNGATIG